MARKGKDDAAKEKSAAIVSEKPLTRDDVQRLIEAAFIRYEVANGRMNADDGLKALAALEQS